MMVSKMVLLSSTLAIVWGVLPGAVRAEDERGSMKIGMGGMRRGGPKGEGMGRREFDPAVRELEHKVREATMRMRKGSDAEKAAAKIEAKKLLGDLLDAKIVLETKRLEKAEKYAAALKEKIAKQKANREKMIESRLSRLSGEGDDWE